MGYCSRCGFAETNCRCTPMTDQHKDTESVEKPLEDLIQFSEHNALCNTLEITSSDLEDLNSGIGTIISRFLPSAARLFYLTYVRPDGSTFSIPYSPKDYKWLSIINRLDRHHKEGKAE